MRRNAFACALLLMVSSLAVLGAQDIAIKNPGDVRVYHKNGDSFYSPMVPNAYGVVPDTIMVEGDAVQTARLPLTFRLANSTITLEPDSLMSFYRLSDQQVALYLLRGRMRISNASGQNGNIEHVILTPTSRFSFASRFSARIVSSDDSEAVYVEDGNALAFNYVTEENVVVRKNGYVDFLEGLSDNIVAVTGGLDSSPSDLPIMQFDANAKSDIPEFVGVRILVEKPLGSAATSIGAASGPLASDARADQVPDERAVTPAAPASGQSDLQEDGSGSLLGDGDSDSKDSASGTGTETVVADASSQARQAKSDGSEGSSTTVINRYYNDYYYYYDKDGNLVTSTTPPEGMSPVMPSAPSSRPAQAQQGGSDASPAAPAAASTPSAAPASQIPDQTRAQVFVRANTGGVVSLGNARVEIPAGALAEDSVVTIEAIGSVNDSDEAIENVTGSVRGYRFLPSGQFNRDVRITLPYDRSLSGDREKLENMRTYLYDEDAREWRALRRASLDEVNCTITSLTNHFTDMMNAVILLPGVNGPVAAFPMSGTSDSRLKLNRWIVGGELGIESAYDGSNIENKDPSPLRLFVRPYTRIENARKGTLFDLKLNLEIDHEYDSANGKYKFTFPQIDNIRNKKLSLFGGIAQFIEDLVIPGAFYISRNYDLPLEYNNLTLRKHNSDHNAYQTYRYASNDGSRTYDSPISFSRKLPGLLDLSIGGLRIRAFADDLEKISRYRSDATDGQYWRRDDDSVNYGEVTINLSPVIFGLSAMYVKGGWDGNDEAKDNVYLAANIGSDKLIDNFRLGFNVAVPMLTYDWTKGSTKPSVKFFSESLNRFMVGFSMNAKLSNMVFDFGFDFSKGQLLTGLLSKRETFDHNSLYTTGIGSLFAIYPYINVDFDFGAVSLMLNADLPIFFGNAGTSGMLAKLKSWGGLDFLYRLNGGAALKLKFGDVMAFNFEYTMDDLLPNRGSLLEGGNTFSQQVKNIWTLWNLIPQFSYTLHDGPIRIKILARHQRVNSTGAVNTSYSPLVSFVSSVAIGNDYLLNGAYFSSRAQSARAERETFRFVFDVNTLYESFSKNAQDAAFTITPRVGFRYKDVFSLIAKFDLENFNIPSILRNGGAIGDYVDTFLEGLNLFDVIRIGRISGVTDQRRSALYEPSYEKNLRANVKAGKFFDLNIADFPEFLNGFLSNSKKTYADLSLGLIDLDATGIYLNYIPQLDWSNGFNIAGPLSLNFGARIDNLYIGADVATRIGYVDKKFTFGVFSGAASTWNALADIGFGYSKANVFDVIFRIGVQNGNLIYNQYDHLTQVENGSFINPFTLQTKNGDAYTGFSQFADVALDLRIGRNFRLDLGYNLPMSLFGSTKGLLTDRVRAKISLDFDTFGLYALFEKRGMIGGPSKSWAFVNNEDLAFKLGLDFKSDYASFNLEAVSSHFLYALGDETESKRAFSVNIGVSFGLR